MKLIIYDYKEHSNTVVHDDVKSIEENYHDGVTLIFESGRYLCIPKNQYSFIEIR